MAIDIFYKDGVTMSRRLKLSIIIAFCFILILPLCHGVVFAVGNSSNKSIVVGVPQDRCPIFYEDESNHEIIGIGIDLMRIAAENAGYDVTFKVIKEPTLKAALDNDEYDLIMPFGSAINSEKGEASIVSENLMETPFTMVTLNKHELQDISHLKVGMLKSLAGSAETVNTLYPDMQITLYEDMDECIEALKDGQVEALLHNSYVWSYVLQSPSHKGLVMHPTTMFSMDFRVGTLDTPGGQALIDSLDDGIAMIKDTQRQAIILDYTSRKTYRFSFSDYLHIYGNIIFIAALIILILAILFITKQRAIKKEHESQIDKLIDYDSLTGALSYVGFRKKVEELLTAHPDFPYLISYSNIKNFKFINDSLGMDAGNSILKFWVERSLELLTDCEAIARINADHIAVLGKVPTDKALDYEDNALFQSLRYYFINQGVDKEVQVCCGIYVLTPEDYTNINVDRMLDYARIAEKKLSEKRSDGFEIYNIEQWEQGKMLADVCGHFSTAIRDGEIKVWYQPQVDYKEKKIVSGEALCRWNHSKLGWLSPGLFVPMLERAGLIYTLDCYVWERVCQDLHRWNQEGKRRSVSVNLSRYDISHNRNIDEYFYNLIKNYDLDPKQLRIEITESAYVEDTDFLLETTVKLQKHGFIVEMDDFGSGYSSLNMLKEVPVNGIKLDYVFLKGEKNKEKSYVIINYIIQMLIHLDFDIIAEGVENAEQADFLLDKGCRHMQGFYFYEPMPVEEFEKLDFDDITKPH